MAMYQSLWQVLWTELTCHSLWRTVGVFCDLVFLSRITLVIATLANVSLEMNQQRWERRLLSSCPGSRKHDSMIVTSEVLGVLPGRDLSASTSSVDTKRCCCSWRLLCVLHISTVSYRDNSSHEALPLLSILTVCFMRDVLVKQHSELQLTFFK